MLSVEVLRESVCPKFSLSSELFVHVPECPVCRSAQDQVLLSKLQESLEFSFCLRCSHMYASRRPTLEWYKDVFYATEWDKKWRLKPPFPGFAAVKGLRRRAVEVYDLLSRRHPTIVNDWRHQIPFFCSPVMNRGEKVLDIGCGYGFALAKFKDEGFSSYGIEATPHRAAYVSANGIPCKNIPVEDLSPETFGTRFDLVIANHVIEHVCDPNVFMESIKKVLDYGKHVCVAVPNFFRAFHYMSFNSPEHVHCFTPRSFATLLARHGFQLRKIQIDRHIRFLAQRVRKADRVPIYDFSKDVLALDDLATVVRKNFFQAPEAEEQDLRAGNYLYSFKSLSSPDFTFNRFVDDSIVASLEAQPAEKIPQLLEQLKSPQKKCMSLCKIDYEGGDVLPIRIKQNDDPAYSFWSNHFYSF